MGQSFIDIGKAISLRGLSRFRWTHIPRWSAWNVVIGIPISVNRIAPLCEIAYWWSMGFTIDPGETGPLDFQGTSTVRLSVRLNQLSGYHDSWRDTPPVEPTMGLSLRLPKTAHGAHARDASGPADDNRHGGVTKWLIEPFRASRAGGDRDLSPTAFSRIQTNRPVLLQDRRTRGFASEHALVSF